MFQYAPSMHENKCCGNMCESTLATGGPGSQLRNGAQGIVESVEFLSLPY